MVYALGTRPGRLRIKIIDVSTNALFEHGPPSSQQATAWLESQSARVILVTGAGKNFCAGIDVASLGSTVLSHDASCAARSAYRFRAGLTRLQEAMTALERVRCPTLALVHGHCVGAGVDLITACDIRFATADAKLCVKEVDLAVIADMGTLQRLPGIVGQGALDHG